MAFATDLTNRQWALFPVKATFVNGRAGDTLDYRTAKVRLDSYAEPQS